MRPDAKFLAAHVKYLRPIFFEGWGRGLILLRTATLRNTHACCSILFMQYCIVIVGLNLLSPVTGTYLMTKNLQLMSVFVYVATNKLVGRKLATAQRKFPIR